MLLFARCTCSLLCLLIVAACGRTPEEYVKRADDFVAEKKYAEAIIDYRNALQKDPQLGQVRLRLADAYSQLGDLQHAYGEYIRAADLLPNNDDAQLKAGAMLLMANRLAEAKTKAQTVLKRAPRNAGALMLLGNALAGTNDLTGAIELVQRAIETSPDTGSAYANLATLQLARGDSQMAEASFKKAVNASPTSTTTRVALANFYRTQGRQSEAEASLKAAAAIDPTDVTVNGNLADLYLRTGRVKEAEAPIRAIAAAMPATTSKLVLAEYYIKANRTNEAAALLDALASDKDSYGIAKARLAVLEYSEGRAPAAHKTLDAILAREPKNARVLLLKGKILAAQKDYEGALKFVRAAAKENAANAAEATLVEAQVYLDRGQLEEAEQGLTQVLSLQPQSVMAQLALSRLHAAVGNRQAAVDFAKQAAAGAPGSAEVRLTLATTLLDAGHFQQAAMELRALQDAYPQSALVQVQIGRLAVAQRDVTRARQAFANALQLDPSSPDALSGLVNLDLEARNAAAAVSRVQARTEAAPQDGRSWYVAARTYLVTGDLVKAEQALLKTVELDPGNPAAFAQLGALYGRLHRTDAAIGQFRNMAARRPRSVGAHTMLGLLLGQQRRHAEARSAFERALEIDPSAPVAANNLAWLHAEAGDNLDLAMQLAQAAYAKLPGDAAILDTLGWVAYRKELVADAIGHLSKAVAREPANPLYQFHLGMAYAKNGDDQEASAALKRAVALKPDFEGVAEAKRMLAELEILGAS